MNDGKLKNRYGVESCLIVKKNDKFINSVFFSMLSLFETDVGDKGVGITMCIRISNTTYTTLYTPDDIKVYQVKKAMSKSSHDKNTDPIDIIIVSPRGEMDIAIHDPIYTEDNELVPNGWAIIGGNYYDPIYAAKRMAVQYDTDVISVQAKKRAIYANLSYEYYLAGSDRLYSSAIYDDLWKGSIGRFISGVKKGV